ncbi:MAG TPA: methyltransferase domain-containing protein [Streptosporangiaceae bacterium]|nr:methyltransferase domain-containing protein [Streptosporangiaceae bacterium]
MVDPGVAERRLAEIYDLQWAERADLDAYVALAGEFGARTVLDIGCGTGTFALRLAGAGFEVTGVDPSAASLEIARAKPGAERVRWVHGVAGDLPPMQADLAAMTANVAQEIVTDQDWDETLRAAFDRLRPGGYLVFETRDPARQAWLTWDREHSYGRFDLPGVGVVEQWFELTDVTGGLVTFSGVYIFESDGLRLTPSSSLRFRGRAEVEASLAAAGFELAEIRDAPDRPGSELVFVARRPG